MNLPLKRTAMQMLLLSAISVSKCACFTTIPSHPSQSPPQSRQTTTTTQLSSLPKLLQNLQTPTTSSPRTLLVGGKGGVGKTTISSALAVSLASTSSTRVLIVSTDPAHSLADALDLDTSFSSSTSTPTLLTDPLTGGNLHALELDARSALDQFRASLQAFDISTLSQSLGISVEVLQGLGLEDVSSLLRDPPPGLDELVALSNVLVLSKDQEYEYDVIVVDTAPTGHALRMLTLPDFLDGFLGKLLKLRTQLSGLTRMVQSVMGGGKSVKEDVVEDALVRLEEFRTRVKELKRVLRDEDRTGFLVVTVPTKLSVSESKRLIGELREQGVSVTDVVVNQCIVGSSSSYEENEESKEAMVKYYARRKAGQDRWVGELKSAVKEVSQSLEYKENGGGEIVLTQVPFMDVELVGTPALGYLGKTVFMENERFDYLMKDCETTKFIICGGKGGVGKTTTSSSLAVSMAASGRNVALVSTDPAHSLGDAFDCSFAGGNLVDVPLVGIPGVVSGEDGSLQVMEIDPKKSLGEFKGLVDQLIGTRVGDGGSGGSNEFGSTLRDLGEIFDTLPAGTDEVVALAKVVGLVKKGNFDRIVLDTAPTGHTLRMLSTPAFISELIEKVLAIAQKVNSNPMVKMMISSAAGGEDLETKAQAARQALLSFQFQMYDLEDLFSNAEQTEFLIVTVPTELAVRESVRLLNDLTFESPDMPIKVRNVVANQILSDDGSDVSIFLDRVANGQRSSIADLESAVHGNSVPMDITRVPYLDTEPRGVFGLKALAEELLKEEEEFIES